MLRDIGSSNVVALFKFFIVDVPSLLKMSSVPYEIIAASKPFRFLVGPKKKEFTMHAELVARMSKPLWTLVNGEWKESKGGLAEWPEIDEETFVRFCEFAYTGDYKAAVPFMEMPPTPPELENGESSKSKSSVAEEMLEPEPALEEQVPEPEPEPEPDPWALPLHSVSKKKSKKKAPELWDNWGTPQPPPPPPPTKKDVMWQEFQERIYDEPNLKPKEEPNTDPSANYSEVFLSHARLYALADYYDIEALVGLCVRKLHRTLKVFNLHEGARVTDVAQLIDYLYKNTRSGQREQDKLRSLVATYAACHIEDLWSNLYFQDVLESGEVSKSILGQLLRRVN
ncbi:hypothetical protein F5Y13DRAFT_153596 [Hypoxylon sp. FL1857]|nr:hypothetical protein F5Y13DRAFT_153596 [Hypoxylon sp. FL1857]